MSHIVHTIDIHQSLCNECLCPESWIKDWGIKVWWIDGVWYCESCLRHLGVEIPKELQ